MAEVVPFKSRFDLDAEAAVARELFGADYLTEMARCYSRKPLKSKDIQARQPDATP